ncbi:MAG: putative deacylase [Promethearchaeota archaeon CR_4]|nr:MAG: putative deacylase [Candidatus Lokiarchaeota archaeon CR_4]
MSSLITKDFLRNYYEKEGRTFAGDRFWSGFHKRFMVHACRHAVLTRWLQDIKLGASFLEVGCEFGFFVRKLAAQRVDATGIDIAQSKIEKARSFAKAENLTCRFEVMDAEYLESLDAKSFDYVLCSEVLEHLPNDELAIKELFRVTKKELILTVPQRSLYWKLMNKFYGFNRFNVIGGGHFREYAFEDFMKKLKQFPCKIREVYFSGFISPFIDVYLQKLPWLQAVLCIRVKV